MHTKVLDSQMAGLQSVDKHYRRTLQVELGKVTDLWTIQ